MKYFFKAIFFMIFVYVLVVLLSISNLVVQHPKTIRNRTTMRREVENINNTVVNYAVKNGGVTGSNGRGQTLSVEELIENELENTNISPSLLNENDFKVEIIQNQLISEIEGGTSNHTAPKRGDIVRVTTSYRVPAYKYLGVVSILFSAVEVKNAAPIITEGYVHQYVN